MKPEILAIFAALIAVFSGLVTVAVATRKRRDRAVANAERSNGGPA